ncbi:glycosyltransferase [Fusobacterium sp.]|uniref:glycosyltransferase n=1 Tax=Fusobacterium sp. TaxID=68766 RepID=UPI002903C13F|nr:glycosyltransferase [Fusobacterium sp.]MDU1912142.1 glycosyltransferase [Fusobacterium sp.]
MEEKISLIVTLYNRLEYARNMILALQQQTKQIDELIFADDGSSEDVYEYIKDLLQECKFKIKYVYQQDIGFRLAASRNNGARIAENEYLIFLDQDVVFDNDFIQRIYEVRKRKRIIFSEALGSSEEEKEKIQKIINEKYDYEKIYKIMPKEKKLEQDSFVEKERLYNILYKLKLRTRGAKIVGLIFSLYKKDYIAVNGFDENYVGWGHEDDDFGNRFFKYGGKTYSFKFEKYPIHMYHKSASPKDGSVNENYYRKIKKEISKSNYKCEYGFNNRKDKDEIKLKHIKK